MSITLARYQRSEQSVVIDLPEDSSGEQKRRDRESKAFTCLLFLIVCGLLVLFILFLLRLSRR
uniref:Uncharacterized protein n=1 Tax=Pristionchus pacificus TaxID=54126 RepID=A0A2A6BD31_PRIPA|eukprot:PDM63792.1 hypothetical protein PRIPAC_49765 [Pristionchus pacificus]